MTLVRLLNENWGFDSNCFVCETKNPTGLRIPFHHDTDTDQVVADFNLGNEFSGAPSYVHGGVSLSILDEAQAWATIAVGGKFAVTSTTSTTFDLPVLVGRDYRVSASLASVSDDTIDTRAVITFGSEDRVCATSTATFTVLSLASAVGALGADVTGTSDASYLRDD
ncbi:MAG TPA: hotdog domain-containing protein [Acidimicrobiales bacterium]|nr:hotdog domain-containing protein [Acidimicrobiales bacterium]